jgi:L-alanine-DL-glutamate epimerase-like enolase superfamily enzyme
MRITRAECQLLRVPSSPSRSSPAEERAGRSGHITVLLVQLDTNAGLSGLGIAYTLQGSGRAVHAVAVDDITALVVGEDPLDHERLAVKFYLRMQSVGRRGLVAQAYSAFDLALWDIKGKAANMPLYKLLGGARDSSEVYGSDTAWVWMTPEQMLEASRPYLAQGIGIKVKVGANAEQDYDRLHRLREALGDDVWIAVDANQRYDYATALAMGQFFEEEIGVAWFEEPISCEDVEGHRRLTESLGVPIAAGETLFGLDEIDRYLQRGALAVLQPDVTRLGGLTPTLESIALAKRYHCPVVPHLMPEVAVHLACGLPQVTMVEWMPWQYPLYERAPRIADGRIAPLPDPGLGITLNAEAVAKYRVA